MNYAIILAGGIGSRFWPLSTENIPKQFLNICSEKPLLLETVKRISGFIRKENIYLATNIAYKDKICNCLKNTGIPLRNFLFEPESKNTLIATALLTSKINQKDKNAVIVILPSDHFIKERRKFLQTLRKAIKISKYNFIVTLGVIPKRPEGGFGYIKRGNLLKLEHITAYKVKKFIEKPGIQRASIFIKDNRFLWNSGIFIFKADILLKEMQRLVPSVYRIIQKNKDMANLRKLWSNFPNISLDYAIMERSKKLALVPLNCVWSDLGSWQTVEEFLKKDRQGNISQGKHIDCESRNITVWAQKRLIATLGLNDLIIVDTKDALLVCAKNKAQEVKKIVKKLKKFY